MPRQRGQPRRVVVALRRDDRGGRIQQHHVGTLISGQGCDAVAAVKRNRFIRLYGGIKKVDRVLEVKARGTWRA